MVAAHLFTNHHHTNLKGSFPICDFGVVSGPMLMAAVSVAMTAATTVASYQAQKAQASAQTTQEQTQAQYITENQQSQLRQTQEQEILTNQQAFQKTNANAMATRAAAATALTGAGEAGVSGNSVDALAREYYSRQGAYDQTVEDNRTADINRLQEQMQGINVNAASQINSMPIPTQPSLLSIPMGIGGGAVDAYKNFIYQPQRGTAGSGL
jgi:hypothetical protein